MQPITAAEVRYIKLGAKGRWEERAIERGEIYFGMPDSPHDLVAKADWEGVRQHWLTHRRGKGMATYVAREHREFEMFGAECLWITFSRGFLWWGFAEPGTTFVGGDGAQHGTIMRKISGGWRNVDIRGVRLLQSSLSTKLTKVTAYRHTMCSVREKDYLLRRINAEEEALIGRAAKVRSEMIAVAALAIADLHWRDFEDLVDLIFARTGWQRVSRVGGNQKDIDLELEHPATQERAFVQVKSRAGQAVLDDYLRRFENGPWDRLFFVTHSPQGALAAADRRNVHVWSSDTLAAAVVRSGLYDWLIQKAA